MDKRNLIIGALLLAASFAIMVWGPKAPPPVANPSPEMRKAAAGLQPAGEPGTPPALVSGTPQPQFSAATTDDASANGPELANSFIKVRFTASGGAIRDVAFVGRESGHLKYAAAPDSRDQPFVFNELHLDPMLALVDFPGLDRGTRYRLVSSSTTQVVYQAVLDNRLEVTRTYTLPPDQGTATDPYQLHAETTIRNLTTGTIAPMKVALSLGTAAPVNLADTAMLLTTGYSDGKDATFTSRSALQASGGLFGLGAHGAQSTIEKPGPIVWGVVTNQFFASILTPAEPATKLTTKRVKLLRDLDDAVPNAYGISAAADFDVKPIAPGASAVLASDLYVGPKEYRRLSNADAFKLDQDKVMQFSRFWPFRWASQLLTTMMSAIHAILPQSTWGWGFAIILSTLTLKIVFLPLTFAAARSMKRMQKLQPEMTALREKYKDNPQKMQAGMMELYKQHKVNPLGGCIPMLIPLPFFMGFYSMLPNTAELRFAPFLWAGDLSSADTIGHAWGLPINILPLLMGATMVFQMRLVPQPPTTDNMQMKMMKIMPYGFTFICYNFSCALALYSTTNGLFTIGQQLVINRMKDDGDPTHAPGAGGKPLKNVTPKKK